MIPEMYLILFMLLFNSLPSMINGGFDKFLNFTTLEQNPELFENSSQNKMFRAYVFWLTLFDSIWQSLVQFYIPLFIFAYSGESFQGYGLESGSSISFYTFGTLVANASLFSQFLHLGIETFTWTWINVVSIFFRYLLFYIFINYVYEKKLLDSRFSLFFDLA
jgi:magnesium-transporting ATPase (P-type)